jgi:hypothetical protein
VLKLVRPRSYALALGLGLVASEVCIPLDQRCLRAAHLYFAGLVVLQDHTNLRTSRYTEVVDGSLHLYLIFNFHIYIAILVTCFTFSSLVDRLFDRIGA